MNLETEETLGMFDDTLVSVNQWRNFVRWTFPSLFDNLLHASFLLWGQTILINNWVQINSRMSLQDDPIVSYSKTIENEAHGLWIKLRSMRNAQYLHQTDIIFLTNALKRAFAKVSIIRRFFIYLLDDNNTEFSSM